MTSLDRKLSKVQVAAIADTLHHDECGIHSLFAQMRQTGHPRAAHNAAWVLSLLSKEDKEIYLLPHFEELTEIATSAAPCIRRGLVLSILAALPTNEPNSQLLDYCLGHLADTQESESARAAMIKLAARMCRPYPELCRELTMYLDMLPPETSPSIAAAKKNALKLIQT